MSRELDVVGDVTAIVDNPSELLAWATALTDPTLKAWRATGSGSRYLHVSATHTHEPIHGQITAILHCEQHLEFWQELGDARDLEAGNSNPLSLTDLSRAWQAMPITPPA